MASVDAQTDERATSAPTDRSMPPPMITKVMPTLTTPITDASRRIVRTLSTEANRSPAVATPTMQRITRAMTRPRLRPSGPAIRPGSAGGTVRGRAGPCPAVVVAPSLMPRPLRTSSMRRRRVGGRSFHDQVEHPVLVERVGRRLGDDDAVGDHQHAVGQAQHLGDLAGDHHDRDPAVGQGADQRVDLRARADVDAAGRLVEQQHPAVAQQPAGQHDLLLVAAGQGADDAGHVGRPDVEGLAPASRAAARSAPPARKPPRENRPRLEMLMLR